MNPLISIIIPIYNIEQYIQQCIDSLLVQTYPTIELILVNDGSTDNSLSLIEEYKGKDSRIKIINKEHGGLGDTRNHGLKHANGELIAFVDGDDWVLPNYIEILYQGLKKNDCDISCVNYSHIHESGDETKNGNFKGYRHLEEKIYDQDQGARAIFYWKHIPVMVWGKMIKKVSSLTIKSNFQLTPFKKMRQLLRYYIFFQKKVIVINHLLYCYRSRNNSLMGFANFNMKFIQDAIAVLKLLKNFLEEQKKLGSVNGNFNKEFNIFVINQFKLIESRLTLLSKQAPCNSKELFSYFSDDGLFCYFTKSDFSILLPRTEVE